MLRAGGFANAEAAARAVNAEPRDPMPGMVKRECPGAATGSPRPRMAKNCAAWTVHGSVSGPMWKRADEQ